ncbi:5506_t:CDS:2 [Ambispora gerdemannii]|uniref:5506_t:CDS:1 n=1 Tax=Ambispora gerdemannii TaxID=144530 RepID=A0A9N9DQS5_9GLOM|nr:5506_t:CDS:2 [Ambispora gerdemannii]
MEKTYDHYSDTTKSLLAELADLVHALTFQDGSDDELVGRIQQWTITKNTTSKHLFKLLRNSIHIPQYACLLAFFYNYSIGTKYNPRKTLKYYQLAADMGDGFGANQTGMCYGWAIGVKQCDLRMEIRYYRISAELGHPQGQSNLAHVIKRRDVPEFCDKREVLFWYLKATETGYPAAFSYVADCYKNGYGTMVDYHMMLRWYTKYLKKKSVVTGLDFLYTKLLEIITSKNKATPNGQKRKPKRLKGTLRNTRCSREQQFALAKNIVTSTFQYLLKDSDTQDRRIRYREKLRNFTTGAQNSWRSNSKVEDNFPTS